MSAIQMTCTHCGGHFIAGMVGMTPWPEHICPDGSKGEYAIDGWSKLGFDMDQGFQRLPDEWQPGGKFYKEKSSGL